MSEPNDRPDPTRPARLTPYELVFEVPVIEEQYFPAIREEIQATGADADVPDRFVMLTTAGRLVHELIPDAVSEEEAGERAREMGHLLFHAYQFWRFGKPVFELDEALARRLASDPPMVGAWELTPPEPAGYLQLPRNLFWSRVSDDTPPEPVDGLFWSLIGREDPKVPPYERVDVLLVLGLRPGRPGFGVIDVAGDLPGFAPGHWADVVGRPEGEDFANILPGGELDALHALTLPAEVLRLLSLVFWQVAVDPRAVVEPDGGAVRRIVEVDADG